MKQKKQSKGAPKWMTTFADLSTLLLTFFILMLSMANIDIVKFRELLGSVKDAFGVQFEQQGDYHVAGDKQVDPVETPAQQEPPPKPAPQKEQNQDWTANFGESESDSGDQEAAVAEIENAVNQSRMGEMAEIQSGSRGIRMRIKGALLFDPGKAMLKRQALPLLDNLADVLNKFDYFLLVEGHTDSIPIKTSRFPSNWELSGARASAVLRHLAEQKIDAKRLTCVGLADIYPLAENSTGQGRAINRRVEFVLTKNAFRPEIN